MPILPIKAVTHVQMAVQPAPDYLLTVLLVHRQMRFTISHVYQFVPQGYLKITLYAVIAYFHVQYARIVHIV